MGLAASDGAVVDWTCRPSDPLRSHHGPQGSGRPSEGGRAAGAAPGNGGEVTVYTRILAAVDGSQPSKLALEHAARLAKEQGALLRVIHVIENPYWSLRFDVAEDLDVPALERAWAQAGRAILDAAAEQARRLGVEPEAALVEPEGQRVAAAVVAEARHWRADLIVLGTHGRHGVEHFLLGSVAEGVARIAPGPLLLLRAVEAPA